MYFLRKTSPVTGSEPNLSHHKYFRTSATTIFVIITYPARRVPHSLDVSLLPLAPPREMMRNNKKLKFSKFGLGGRVKGENESIESKDIFEFLFPNGWLNNPLYKDGNQDDCNDSDNDDDSDDRNDNDAFSSVTAASLVAKNKVPQAFFVV